MKSHFVLQRSYSAHTYAYPVCFDFSHKSSSRTRKHKRIKRLFTTKQERANKLRMKWWSERRNEGNESRQVVNTWLNPMFSSTWKRKIDTKIDWSIEIQLARCGDRVNDNCAVRTVPFCACAMRVFACCWYLCGSSEVREFHFKISRENCYL